MSSTYGSFYNFDLDHKGRELENGLLFHSMPRASLGVKITRGYLEDPLPLIKVKQRCQKLSLSEGSAQSWKDDRIYEPCQDQ